MRKPNLIVFLPDQQRTDTISCYPGGEKVHSPNLARLASESVIFERSYVTQPVCTPSRSSLMTGLWPHTNGCTRNSVPLAEHHRTLVELLNDPDYVAGYMGKWHLGEENTRQRGFAEWISTEGVSDYAHFLIGAGEKPVKSDGIFSSEQVSRLPLDISKPRFLEKNACDFIKRHQKQPFILYVAFVEPHSPYFGPLNDDYPLADLALSETSMLPPAAGEPLRYKLMREWQEEQAVLDRKRLPSPYYFGLTPEEYLLITQRYLGLVAMVDRSIGDILDCLDSEGVRDETIIVHTSDHGDMLGAHRLFGKEVMYEEATRVPLLVSMPGQRQSARVSQAVSHIDLVPTLLDLLGDTVAEGCQGSTFSPLLLGESLPALPVFMEWSPNRSKLVKRSSIERGRTAKRAMEESTRTVVTIDGWKCSLRDRDLCELYHMESDPSETNNLYTDASCSSIVARCRREIDLWQERVNDDLAL